MTDWRKLIEMDGTLCKDRRLEYYIIMGGGQRSWVVFVSVATQAYPRRIVSLSANDGSKSCIFGIPLEQVVIGSASLEWGMDIVDIRIWFAY